MMTTTTSGTPPSDVFQRARSDSLLGALLRDAWRRNMSVGDYITRVLRPRNERPYYRRLSLLGPVPAQSLFLLAQPLDGATSSDESGADEHSSADTIDPVEFAALASFPASDPPSWGPISHLGPPPTDDGPSGRPRARASNGTLPDRRRGMSAFPGSVRRAAPPHWPSHETTQEVA